MTAAEKLKHALDGVSVQKQAYQPFEVKPVVREKQRPQTARGPFISSTSYGEAFTGWHSPALPPRRSARAVPSDLLFQGVTSYQQTYGGPEAQQQQVRALAEAHYQMAETKERAKIQKMASSIPMWSSG